MTTGRRCQKGTGSRCGAAPTRQRGALGEPHAHGHARPGCSRDAKPPALMHAACTGHAHATSQRQQALRHRLRSRSRLPGLASVSQGDEGTDASGTPRAGALPAAAPPSDAVRPGNLVTHTLPLLFKVRRRTRPFLIIWAARLDYLLDTRAVTASFPPSCPNASHGSQPDAPLKPASQSSTRNGLHQEPPRTQQRLSTWDPSPTVFTVLEMKTKRSCNRQTHYELT